MAIEANEIRTALASTGGNVGRAASRLGASRRTLQNRMRYYSMPPGRSGRPRHTLSYQAASGISSLVGVAALLGMGWLAGRWWRNRNAPTVAGDNASLHGTDILGSL